MKLGSITPGSRLERIALDYRVDSDVVRDDAISIYQYITVRKGLSKHNAEVSTYAHLIRTYSEEKV